MLQSIKQMKELINDSLSKTTNDYKERKKDIGSISKKIEESIIDNKSILPLGIFTTLSVISLGLGGSSETNELIFNASSISAMISFAGVAIKSTMNDSEIRKEKEKQQKQQNEERYNEIFGIS